MRTVPRFILLFSSLAITPIVLLVAIIFSLSIAYKAYDHNKKTMTEKPPGVAYAALPTNENVLAATIVASDARVEVVRQFMERYKSPLEPYAQHIVATADKYDMDHRLIPAIAMQESGLCKKNRKESFNCWGFGVYGKKYHHFDNYEQAIDAVSKTLAEKYIGIGLTTPRKIMTKYTPSSNGSWANGVEHFMAEMN
jgi:hypothetical protein